MLELREAVLMAAKFALPHRGKDPNPLSGIRLLPASGDFPARLFATRGESAILLDVEGDLPNLVIDAVGIEAAARAEPEASVVIEGEMARVGRYKFRPWCSVEVFPGMPSIPGPEVFQTIHHTGLIPLVLHAASESLDRPELHYLSFRPGVVEATDATRVARAPIGINRTVQIHKHMFEAWPGGSCEFAVEASIGAVFRWPGQVRWGLVYAGHSRPYPDLSRIEDDRDDPVQAVVPVDAFRHAVRKATTVSPLKSVTCQFRPGAIEVAALFDARGARVAGYQDTVPALCVGAVERSFSGTSMAAALGVLGTPRVLIGVGAPTDAVVLRSGSYVEHIWPVAV